MVALILPCGRVGKRVQKMDEQSSTRDLYEAAWYYVNGCRIETVQCVRNGEKKPVCFFTFQGTNMAALQLAYVSQAAVANVWQLKQAYGELTELVNSAQKQFRLQGGAS